MKVGWVSHQWPSTPQDRGAALLPGRYAGGAEFLQEKMREAAPDGIDWLLVNHLTTDVSVLDDCDRVIVASPESVNYDTAMYLRQRNPILWCMSDQSRSNRDLFDAADVVLWASYRMRGWYPWAPTGDVVQGWFPTADVPRGTSERNGKALWAARWHPQKGLDNAKAWADGHNCELTVMTGAAREDVLNAMAEHTYFVLLPNWRDPGPVTVAEATIAGCETITNDYVGVAPVQGAEAMVEWIEQQPSRFYRYL